ncbi:MAG: TonB-dependent receptor, partial [Gammaproteobacteria bacterium]
MHRENLIPRSLVVVLSVSGGSLLTDALAQEAGTIEEVIVTARKREENLQQIPISVSAYTGEALDARGVTKIDKLTDFTPNLVFHNTPTFSGTTSNAVIYIRGVGQNDFTPTIDQGVGIYVDGVFLGRSVGSVLDLVDIERVEVLRGPQGTLFGRNTIGGALNITTKKPAEEFGGKVDLKVGTDARVNVRGTVDVPLTDRFFSKFSAASFQQDGYVTRPFDGEELGNDDTVAARAAFRWLPMDGLEINFAGDYSRDDENGAPDILTGFDPAGPPPPFPPSQVVFNNLVADLFSGGVGN